MKKAKQWFALVAVGTLVLTLGACSKKEEPPTQGKGTAAKAETGGAPKIVAVQDTFNFGKVKQGTAQEHIFKLRNDGNADLKIEKAKGS